MTDERSMELEKIGEWVIQTCLLLGAPAATAYKVAIILVEAVDKEWTNQGR